jgi:RimJ/RimL family protein N-acetyltransferase
MIRDAGSGAAIGGIGFFGPPDADGAVEIGYGIVPSMRRRGLATAAVRHLLRVAAEHGVTVVRADTTPENHASIGVLRRVGMTESRRSDDAVFFEVRLPREDDTLGTQPCAVGPAH